MPEYNGLSFLRQAEETLLANETPVMVFSANPAQVDDEIGDYRRLVTDVLSKPHPMMQLLRKLETVVGRSSGSGVFRAQHV